MKRACVVSLLLAVAAVVVAPAAHSIVLSAQLDGPSEAPPNASPGTGTAMVTIDSIAHMMLVEADFAGLTGNTTAAHIHCCTAVPMTGAAGVATAVPSFPGFPLGVTSGVYSMLFDLMMASSFNPAFVTANGGTAASAEAALVAGLLEGRAYFNIHTTQFGGGEIRGFLVPEPGTIALLALGFAATYVARRRSRR